MVSEFKTVAPPEANGVSDWLARLRANQELSKAQELIANLAGKFPESAGLQYLLSWHDPIWWRPIEFGAITLKRRGPEHFNFLWPLVLDQDFSSLLKNIPPDLSPKDLLQILTREASSIIPEARLITWVVYKEGVPVGTTMFVNINFKNRSAEQVMGLLPGLGNPVDVANSYAASLCFAFNSLGLNKVKGLIYTSNEKVALMQEKLGFTREGIFREAVWNEPQQKYLDQIQISMLYREFLENRVLQRYIGRQPRPAYLLERNQWPRSRPPVSPECGYGPPSLKASISPGLQVWVISPTVIWQSGSQTNPI
jgi:hypothetical protein